VGVALTLLAAAREQLAHATRPHAVRHLLRVRVRLRLRLSDVRVMRVRVRVRDAVRDG
jgi:hypothetical protein